MTDYSLQIMMNNLKKSNKDKIDEAIEKDIKAYVDSLSFEDDPNAPQLVSPEIRKAILIEKLKADIQGPVLAENLDKALAFIKTDGLHYIDRFKYESLISEFNRVPELLEKADLSNEIPEILQDFLQISDETLDSIYEIANGAFIEERTQESLSVFVLLTTLDPTDGDYWFRLGIAAQRSGNNDLALKAYEISVEIDPEIIGARLFSVDCYLNQNDHESAMDEMIEAKKIIAQSDVDPIWLDLIAILEEREKSAA